MRIRFIVARKPGLAMVWDGLNYSKYQIPFRNCCVKGGFEKAKRERGIRSQTWLILTDKTHKVAPEGFGFNALDAKMQEMIGDTE